jgi:hypothetical protein
MRQFLWQDDIVSIVRFVAGRFADCGRCIASALGGWHRCTFLYLLLSFSLRAKLGRWVLVFVRTPEVGGDVASRLHIDSNRGKREENMEGDCEDHTNTSLQREGRGRRRSTLQVWYVRSAL